MNLQRPIDRRWLLLPALLLAVLALAWLFAPTTPAPAERAGEGGGAGEGAAPPASLAAGQTASTAVAPLSGSATGSATGSAAGSAAGSATGAASGAVSPATAAGSAAEAVVEAKPVAAIVDIFAVRTWEPPPPPVVAAAAPPPEAPPLPFTFLGRIAEAGGRNAFMLAHGARVVVVRVGDRITEDYRLEKYEKGQLLFRYRPMNVRQSLAAGDHS